jgi:hypothetical protein
MRTKLIILVALVVTLALMVVSPALAGQQTRILYGLENEDYYTYTPTAAGYLEIQISWQDDAGGTPGYPVAEVDGVCQAWNSAESEAYWDYDLAGLYASTNPEVDVLQVTADMVGEPVYVGVTPFVGDVPYRIQLGWGTKANGPFTNVYDSGAINPATSPRAHGIDAKFYLPAIAGATTPWHSVSIWPGSSSGTQYADYDDYVWNYDYAKTIANNWSSLNYYGPLVTDVSVGKALTGDWFIAAPEVWTAAAVPNDWTGGSIYPKPGNLAYNAAPITYTYSWGQDATTANTAYYWAPLTSASAGRLSYSSAVSTGAKITATFYGTSVTWVYTKNSASGVAKVTIDGVDKGTIDQYNATPLYKQSTTYSGLSAATHTIVIENNKTKNPASSKTFINHDGFVAPGFSGDVHSDMQNNMDGSTLYDWARLTSASASGGFYSSDLSTGAMLAFSFEGTSITWKYTKNSASGIARVYIDGVDKGTVDQYAASPAYQQTSTYSGLAAGWHTILITNNKTKNPSSSRTFINHDCFDVGGTIYEN